LSESIKRFHYYTLQHRRPAQTNFSKSQWFFNALI